MVQSIKFSSRPALRDSMHCKTATLQNNIKLNHPYAVAEISHIKIDSGDPEYLNWITASIQ